MAVLPSTVVVVGDRYQIESQVGEGGMATVYRAVDLATGQTVALKRMHRRESASRVDLTAQFQREYLVLSQLAHPRIVAAYDYGVDDNGPFYTMELLDGSDLSRSAPLSYRSACAIGRDVCSALSLIHSRRLVYRDLSPHNVRCTADGLAKLIDFGALAPMGPRRELVGTLPCVAPEVVAMRPLDGRTDLYAFGATLYYLLVRRHAFPARTLEELSEAWKHRPPAPSALVPDVPAALDALVFDLLDPDPARRPQSAAEVMERLRAIGELDLDENLLVKSAYLSKPALVGREEALFAFHQTAQLAHLGRGATLRITGASGMGLSRVLESCGLDAQLSGWTVLCGSGATDAKPYATAAMLGRALLTAAPRLARTFAEPHLGVLGTILPELIEGRTDVKLAEFSSPDAQHRQVQPALRAWFLQMAAERPLFVAVDDVHLLDVPSVALLAALAGEAKRNRLLIAVTQPSDQSPSLQLQRALKALDRTASTIVLSALTEELTHSLLESVFGEVPHLDLLTRTAHQATHGVPRDIMALAQYLVDEGTIRYEAGTWWLPPRLSGDNLPPTMGEALRQRLQKLDLHARQLAYALSREPTLTFGFDECEALLPEASEADVQRALDALTGVDVLACRDGRYQCTHWSWQQALAQLGDEDERRSARRRLAQLFARRDDIFRKAAWLLRAGDQELALTALYDFSVASKAKTDDDPRAYYVLLQSLPEDWLEVCEAALPLYEQHARPPRERIAVLSRMGGMFWIGLETDAFGHLRILLRQLARDSGLDCFADLPQDMAPGERIRQALGRAHARYLSLPEHERVLDPGTALRELVKAMILALGNIATTSNIEAYHALPSLEPVQPLSPGIALIHQLVQGMGHRLGARAEKAIEVYAQLLERLSQPDRAGLTPSHHLHTVTRIMGTIGTLEAPMGRAACLAWADKVEGEPAYQHVSALIRYLYHLWRGETREAKRARRSFEVLQLETNAGMDLQHVFVELCAYALASDMTGVRRAVETLDSASLHAAARAALHYGRAEYHRIRGDLKEALTEAETAVSLMEAGEHLVWANAAGAHVRILTLLGRVEEARALGEAYLHKADAAGLGYEQTFIRCPLSLAILRTGDFEGAQRLAQAAVEVCRGSQISGLTAELAHETAVAVAEAMGDEETLASSLPHCSARFRRIIARHARAQSVSTDAQLATGPAATTNHDLEAELASTLYSARSVEECAERGLEFVTRYFEALGGVLFVRKDDSLVRLAAVGEALRDEALSTWAEREIARQESAQQTEMISLDDDESTQFGSQAGSGSDAFEAATAEFDAYVSVPLAHYGAAGFALTGIVALHAPSKYVDAQRAQRLGAELSRMLSIPESAPASLPPSP